MDFIKKNGKGLLFCLALAVPSAVLGKLFPVVGGTSVCNFNWNDTRIGD